MPTSVCTSVDCDVHVVRDVVVREENTPSIKGLTVPPLIKREQDVLRESNKRLARSTNKANKKLRKRIDAILEAGWTPWHYSTTVEESTKPEDIFWHISDALSHPMWRSSGEIQALRERKLQETKSVNVKHPMYFGLLDNPHRWEKDRYSDNVWGERLFYIGLIPEKVLEKYKRDKKLFDRVYVASYNREMFSFHVLSSVLTGDPFLVGRINVNGKDAFFLGAVWDIDEEMKASGK